MTTRIRYKKNEYGALVSKEFKTPTNEYIVIIAENGTYRIDDREKNPLIIGKKETLNEVKKEVKKELINLGVLFESEVRPRIKNNEGQKTKEEVLKLYQDSIKDDQ